VSVVGLVLCKYIEDLFWCLFYSVSYLSSFGFDFSGAFVTGLERFIDDIWIDNIGVMRTERVRLSC